MIINPETIPNFTELSKIKLFSESEKLIKELRLASTDSLLLPEDLIEYGAKLVPDKFKFNSDPPIRYLTSSTIKQLSGDITKLSKTLLPTGTSLIGGGDIDFFGTIKVDNKKIIAIYVESGTKVVEFLSTAPVFTITLGTEKEEVGSDCVIWLITDSETGESSVRLSYLAFLSNSNPLRNLNRTYLRNDELYNITTNTSPIEKLDGTEYIFDSLTGTLLANKNVGIGAILRESLFPDTYSLTPYCSNAHRYIPGEVISVGPQYYKCTKECTGIVELYSDDLNLYYSIDNPQDSPNWESVGSGYTGESTVFAPSLDIVNKVYERGDLIVYGGKLYECVGDQVALFEPRFGNLPDLVVAARNPDADEENWRKLNNTSKEVIIKDYRELGSEYGKIEYKKGTVVRFNGNLYYAEQDTSNYCKFYVTAGEVFLVTIPGRSALWKELESIENYTSLPDTYKSDGLVEYEKGELVIYKSRVYQSLVSHNYNFDPSNTEKVVNKYSPGSKEYLSALATTGIEKIYTGRNITKVSPKGNENWHILDKVTIFEYDHRITYNQGDLAYWNGEIWVSTSDGNVGEPSPATSNKWIQSFGSINYFGNLVRIVGDESKVIFPDNGSGIYSFIKPDKYDIDCPKFQVKPGYKLRSFFAPKGNMNTSCKKVIKPLDNYSARAEINKSLGSNIDNVIVGSDYYGYYSRLCSSFGQAEGEVVLGGRYRYRGGRLVPKAPITAYDQSKQIEYWKKVELNNNNFRLDVDGPFKLPIRVFCKSSDGNYINATSMANYKIKGSVDPDGNIDPNTEFSISFNLPDRTEVSKVEAYYTPIDFDDTWKNTTQEAFIGENSIKEPIKDGSVSVIKRESVTDIEIKNSITKNGALAYVFDLLNSESMFYIKSYYDVELSGYSFYMNEESELTVTSDTVFNGFSLRVSDKDSNQVFSVEYWIDQDGVFQWTGEGLTIKKSPKSNFLSIEQDGNTLMMIYGIQEDDGKIITYLAGGDIVNYPKDLYIDIEAIRK